jgi:streptogramin lyase
MCVGLAMGIHAAEVGLAADRAQVLAAPLEDLYDARTCTSTRPGSLGCSGLTSARHVASAFPPSTTRWPEWLALPRP